MRFGPVSLDQALGAILAHSVQLGAARLRKGCVLGVDDLAALAASGLDRVVVARPDPGDLPEDQAATALARALVPDPQGQGLRPGQSERHRAGGGGSGRKRRAGAEPG